MTLSTTCNVTAHRCRTQGRVVEPVMRYPPQLRRYTRNLMVTGTKRLYYSAEGRLGSKFHRQERKKKSPFQLSARSLSITLCGQPRFPLCISRYFRLTHSFPPLSLILYRQPTPKSDFLRGKREHDLL